MNRHTEAIFLIAILVCQTLVLVVLSVFVFSRLSVAPIDVFKKVEEVDAKITIGILDRWTETDQRIFMDQLRTLNPNITVPIIEE